MNTTPHAPVHTTGGRVVLISHHADIIGGGEISLLTLIRGLLGTSWQPILVVSGEGMLSDRARTLQVDTHVTPLPPARSLFRMLPAARRLRRLVRRLQPDVVHANGSRAMFYAALAARAAGCASIWHLRIIDPDPWSDALLGRLATASIATSGPVRERLRPWPAAYARCTVIPNGLDLEGFTPRRSRAEVRRALGIPGDEVVGLTVGRLVEGKGHEILLAAITKLGADPKLRFLIVGDGPLSEALQRRAVRDGVAGSVTFTGHRDDVADLLAAADFFVLPSLVEGFGRVLIEAMALRLPVVAIAGGGPGEIVDEGVNGFLAGAPTAEALATAIAPILRDAALRDRLGAAGREKAVEQYSMQEHARRVTALYAAVAASAS